VIRPKFSEHGATLVPGQIIGYRCWRPGALDGDANLYDLTSYVEWGQFLRSDAFRMTMSSPAMPPDRRREMVLASVSVSAYWGGSRIKAECAGRLAPVMNDRPKSEPHASPDEDCVCGIYGWYEPGRALYEHTASIIGAVVITGHTVLGTLGFRASEARIVGLAATDWGEFEPPPDAGQLLDWFGRRYQGVEFFDDWRQLASQFPPSRNTLHNLGINTMDLPRRYQYLSAHQVARYSARGLSWNHAQYAPSSPIILADTLNEITASDSHGDLAGSGPDAPPTTDQAG